MAKSVKGMNVTRSIGERRTEKRRDIPEAKTQMPPKAGKPRDPKGSIQRTKPPLGTGRAVKMGD